MLNDNDIITFEYGIFPYTDEEKQKMKNILNQLNNHIIPERYPNHMIKKINPYLRERVIDKIGFSLICKEWIKPLAKWIGDRKCLEVMAGCGSLSYSLQQEGVNIIPTDNFSWHYKGNWNSNKNYWCNIENIDALEAVEKYGKNIDIIIISWATMDSTALQVLQIMRKVNPNCVMIFIGEGYGGCTADDDFFDNLIEIEADEEFNKINNFYPRWDGIHDCLWLVK